MDASGEWVEEQMMEELITSYFENIFTTASSMGCMDLLG